MKCKDFEQDIYLHSELSEAERIRVDAHIQKCDACKELFQVVSNTQVLIEQVSLKKPEIANHGKLTSTIMQALNTQEKQSSINGLFFKYGMVAVSLVLIVWFISEQQTSIEPPKQHIASAVRLTSQPLGKIIKKDEEKAESLYACIKSESCNNTLFSNLKQKRF